MVDEAGNVRNSRKSLIWFCVMWFVALVSTVLSLGVLGYSPYLVQQEYGGVISLGLLFVAGALFVVGARLLRFRSQWARTTVVVLPSLVGVVGLCAWGGYVYMEPMFRSGPVETLAASPDGRFEVVGQSEGFITTFQVLRLRSREGLLSRESPEIACFGNGTMDSPEVLLGRLAFTGPAQVTLWSDDGGVGVVDFDPETLQPAHPYDRCLVDTSDAPGPSQVLSNG
ncbi:hypothetical protein [Catellatospora coxensis]|uniref:Uncharacterized protein n=1 Tax=Catellatospora coxensis TaxID=310354 RepID=A0A8J3P7P9_9ACTN|nr:hypothetical protein [Catellatospora coxensis]GIG06857.1 hypothetical protein Cco03nite_35570 [Catellatospora coxensis]